LAYILHSINADTVNAFSFHPYLPMAATSSGHRRFAIPDDDDGEDKNELQLKGTLH